MFFFCADKHGQAPGRIHAQVVSMALKPGDPPRPEIHFLTILSSILKIVMPLFVGAISVVGRRGGMLARERCRGPRWRERKLESVMRGDADKS